MSNLNTQDEWDFFPMTRAYKNNDLKSEKSQGTNGLNVTSELLS